MRSKVESHTKVIHRGDSVSQLRLQLTDSILALRCGDSRGLCHVSIHCAVTQSPYHFYFLKQAFFHNQIKAFPIASNFPRVLVRIVSPDLKLEFSGSLSKPFQSCEAEWMVSPQLHYTLDPRSAEIVITQCAWNTRAQATMLYCSQRVCNGLTVSCHRHSTAWGQVYEPLLPPVPHHNNCLDLIASYLNRPKG